MKNLAWNFYQLCKEGTLLSPDQSDVFPISLSEKPHNQTFVRSKSRDFVRSGVYSELPLFRPVVWPPAKGGSKIPKWKKNVSYYVTLALGFNGVYNAGL
jgi:hypothetical protein